MEVYRNQWEGNSIVFNPDLKYSWIWNRNMCHDYMYFFFFDLCHDFMYFYFILLFCKENEIHLGYTCILKRPTIHFTTGSNLSVFIFFHLLSYCWTIFTWRLFAELSNFENCYKGDLPHRKIPMREIYCIASFFLTFL